MKRIFLFRERIQQHVLTCLNVPLPCRPPPPGSPIPRSAIDTSISDGSIAAVVLAGVLFFVLAALLVYYCLIHRPRARRCQAQFDAMLARTMKGGSPAVRSQVTRASERSSYRKRLNRIISMIGPNSSGQWSGRRPPPVPPIGISRTTEQFYDNNAIPNVGDEIEVVPIGEPTTTVESAHRLPEDIKGTRRVPSIFIDITQKPSPEASIPVSPTSVSIGATQSQRQSSQNSSRPHSNTFSIPISFSLRHIRARSKENGSTGSSGRQQGRGSSSVGHRDVGVEHAVEEEDGSVDSESTIAFAKPTTPRRLTSWRGISENTGEAKRWSAREGVGKAIHSILSGLRNARGRWIRTPTGTGVVYPFVGVASSSVPFGTRHAVSGGGFIVLEGGRSRLAPRLSGSPTSSARDSKRPRSESPHSQGTGQETDITPLSYVNRSLGSLLARDNDLQYQRNDDSGALLATLPPPRHPYAAVADSPPPPPAAIPATITSLGDDGAREPAKILTVPVPAIRQLPPVPTPPHTNISQPLPSHVADDSTGRIAQVVRPIRALPPLPIPPVSEVVTETSGPVTTLSSPSRTRPPPPLELGTSPEVGEHEGSLLSPKSASDVHTESQRTSRSSKSSKGSSLAEFLTISSMSPFRVDFLEMGSVEGSEGSDSGRNSSIRRGKQKERRPVPPKLNVALGSTSTRPISLPPALEAARHAIQRSFLDMSGSSSSFGKPEPNSPAEPPPETYTQVDRVEVDEDRATFGQKRDRKSVYYYSSANPPLPSPADSHHTFQTHRTYQTYQSEEQSSHRPWSKGRHASWRATFGVRQDIPEEATPSTPDVPSLPPEIAEALSQNIATGPLTTLQEIPECHALTSLPQETPSDPDRGRLSYVSTSPTVATHVHPLTTDFGLRQQARHRSLHPDVSTGQLDATSPTTDEVSPSSIQFGAGGIRRTSSGDVEPASRAYHTKDESTASGDSNIQRLHQGRL